MINIEKVEVKCTGNFHLLSCDGSSQFNQESSELSRSTSIRRRRSLSGSHGHTLMDMDEMIRVKMEALIKRFKSYLKMSWILEVKYFKMSTSIFQLTIRKASLVSNSGKLTDCTIVPRQPLTDSILK